MELSKWKGQEGLEYNVSWNFAGPPSNVLKEARSELLSSIQNLQNSKPKLIRAVSDDKILYN